MRTPKELQSLKEKIAAIQSGDYDVEAENPKLVKCWERLNCGKTDCPAYGKLRCWSIVGTCCHSDVQGQFVDKVGDCRKCVVFQESCDDEIGELVEDFNLMVKEIKHNIAQQEQLSREEAKSARLSEIGDMAAAVAHETRNPLHSIGMAVAYLKKIFQGELGTEFLTIIEEETEKLNTLIGLFMKFSSPAPLNIEPQDLNAIVAETLRGYEKQAAEREVELLADLAGDLPEVPGDRQRLEEAVHVLVENGLEAITGRGRIVVRTRRYSEHVKISVQDDGAGIPAAAKREIFKPFYTTKVHGPGLGLSILERTAREHNGTVDFCSTEGEGSVFSLFLPVAED